VRPDLDGLMREKLRLVGQGSRQAPRFATPGRTKGHRLKNMEGAGSMRVANYLYNAAPRDGTSFGTADLIVGAADPIERGGGELGAPVAPLLELQVLLPLAPYSFAASW
jgi:hypothetical protein